MKHILYNNYKVETKQLVYAVLIPINPLESELAESIGFFVVLSLGAFMLLSGVIYSKVGQVILYVATNYFPMQENKLFTTEVVVNKEVINLLDLYQITLHFVCKCKHLFNFTALWVAGGCLLIIFGYIIYTRLARTILI